jgi:hypothetical protein
MFMSFLPIIVIASYLRALFRSRAMPPERVLALAWLLRQNPV